jgi:hypothetical protein
LSLIINKDKLVDFDSPASPAARAAVAWIIDDDPQNLFKKKYDESKSKLNANQSGAEQSTSGVEILKKLRSQSVPHSKFPDKKYMAEDQQRHSLSFTNDDFQLHSTVRAVSTHKRKSRVKSSKSTNVATMTKDLPPPPPKKHEFLKRSANPYLVHVAPKKSEKKVKRKKASRKKKNKKFDITASDNQEEENEQEVECKFLPFYDCHHFHLRNVLIQLMTTTTIPTTTKVRK